MNSFSKPIEDHNILFEQFLGDNNSEVELEYDETLLEQLINQNSILLDAENIESNKQSNIFTLKIFMEINKYNSSSDDEIDDDNEQNLKNESESHENEIYIMDETSTSLSLCAIVDIIDGKLQTCSRTWQINTSIVAKFLDGKKNGKKYNTSKKKYTSNLQWTIQFCFEINGRHIYQKNGSEKSKFNCENDGLHDEDSDKILVVLANWLLLVVKNERNKLAKGVWKSREELNKQKAEIQNLTFLENYYLAFPSYLTEFLEIYMKIF
ncbi:hypothetical protein RhiirA5_422743 [Rhizophagus irregularis]|uniref:Uncharacterized protein n=1 Tax=Rhizophagus irregularis TaxID=588596 RepID=A0A2I1E7U4_9GLOM|nr:hypothetical protein RhiirA5_422743 [Rhizophagus irregularis]PKC74514.1 hypothetical protein RhiirA1_449862 [Rhizophagus irregularis]PKY18197.1 hypothetical protein RhiirB3_430965 [Rhizophagus irregularis]